MATRRIDLEENLSRPKSDIRSADVEIPEKAGAENRIISEALHPVPPGTVSSTDPSPFARTEKAGPGGAESRETRIAQAAYHRAERRGFAAGEEMDDWLAAEREIDRQS